MLAKNDHHDIPEKESLGEVISSLRRSRCVGTKHKVCRDFEFDSRDQQSPHLPNPKDRHGGHHKSPEHKDTGESGPGLCLLNTYVQSLFEAASSELVSGIDIACLPLESD